MVREIKLTRGLVALVDDEDYERVAMFKWCATPMNHYSDNGLSRFYAVRTVDHTTVRLHRSILNATPDIEIDHRDGDGLNCRRDNLRVATRGQNQANQKRNCTNRSGFKGVCWSSRRNKWRVSIGINGRQIEIACVPDIIEAALIYDAAARNLFGDFCRLNFPNEGEQSA